MRIGKGPPRALSFLTLGVAKRGTRPPYQPQTDLGVAGANRSRPTIGRRGIHWSGWYGDRCAGSEPKVNPQALQFWDILWRLGGGSDVNFVLWLRLGRACREENIAAGLVIDL